MSGAAGGAAAAAAIAVNNQRGWDAYETLLSEVVAEKMHALIPEEQIKEARITILPLYNDNRTGAIGTDQLQKQKQDFQELHRTTSEFFSRLKNIEGLDLDVAEELSQYFYYRNALARYDIPEHDGRIIPDHHRAEFVSFKLRLNGRTLVFSLNAMPDDERISLGQHTKRDMETSNFYLQSNSRDGKDVEFYDSWDEFTQHVALHILQTLPVNKRDQARAHLNEHYPGIVNGSLGERIQIWMPGL